MLLTKKHKITKQKISKLFFVNSGFVKTCDEHVPSLAFLKEFLSVFKRENSGFVVSELVVGSGDKIITTSDVNEISRDIQG